MTLMQVEKRVKVLEKAVRQLARGKSVFDRNWYRTRAGRFTGDPDFEEIVRLGRAYRKSLSPAPHSRQS
jgi:hypothetical protein